MLATREDRRGQRIALLLGAQAIIHMWEQHGARGFMTGGLLPGAVIDSSNDANAALTADRVLDAVAGGEALFVEARGE
jgi:hypothetical protein